MIPNNKIEQTSMEIKTMLIPKVIFFNFDCFFTISLFHPDHALYMIANTKEKQIYSFFSLRIYEIQNSLGILIQINKNSFMNVLI
jgi:hypothetical protein